jgi:hypothetical protein
MKNHLPSSRHIIWKWKWLLLALCAGIILALAAGGIVRYLSPLQTVRSYYTDLSQNNYPAAQARTCPAAHGYDPRIALEFLQGNNTQFDTTQLNYHIQSEDFSTAKIWVQGTVYSKGAFSDHVASDFSDFLTLQADGMGWCVAQEFVEP